MTYFLANDQGQVIDQTKDGQGGMFTVFSRVGTFIDVMVDGVIAPRIITIPVPGERYVDYGSNSDFILYRTMRSTNMIGALYNTGNIAVTGDVVIQWSTW